ncbi:hypothetical protein [Fructobacillus evanidus]|uniref:Uncharacterized protein n=1 Tax=Fructobacillus evanidus TaxID=3064281 RepID=A0ABN9YPC0_9LACO|nr:hypothetical protein R55250_KEHBDPNM_00055 [Fructobacillus sp. LMG 32999]CAK1221719.1 hypothetical protein R53718_MFFEMHAI_00055 [Fructobacillus sp. LMG 32999]CAK1225702.1 hypothetical protein R55234_GCHJJDIB_00055 [Fructobacillus sp. LMG 32999]CAK1228497.1 hypothetical protein R54837_OMAIDLJD_00239 [Fructobacillus sp. LMG 32999]CAK1228700.1 hypothetical protein R53534_HOPDCFKK_00240 [Fructobacillus sp. LMG 32999]
MKAEDFFHEYSHRHENDELVGEIEETQDYWQKIRQSRRGLIGFALEELLRTDGQIMEANQVYEHLLEKKAELIAHGGSYPLMEVDLREAGFNHKIETIDKMEVITGDYMWGQQNNTFTVVGDDLIASSYFVKMGTEETDDLNFKSERLMTKADFFQALKDLRVGSWERKYVNESVMDGTQWSVRIYFNRGLEVLTIEGSNDYPENMEEFNRVFNLDLFDDGDADDEGEFVEL